MPAEGVEVEITYKFHRTGRLHTIGTAFTETEISDYMNEFECTKEYAIQGLAGEYLFNNFFGALLEDAKEKRI